jgi:endonuclease YncB( thermonuclease family)
MSAGPAKRYSVITGRFWIHYPDIPGQGPEPDGDTVRFEPNDPMMLEDLPRFSGRPPDLNARGNIAVRYEGIDALETHFKEAHQDLAFANAARDRNLALLGFRDVAFSESNPNKVASVQGNPAEGFVIANGIEANGRLLGLVYTGGPPAADGDKVFVDEVLFDGSLNARLVAEGHAYVEPYDTMPMALVRHARGIVKAARAAGKGLFAVEDVAVGRSTQIQDLATLKTLVLWPKLFRRLTSYFAEGHVGLGGFDAWIRRDRIHQDDTLRLPDGEKGNMHDAYRIEGDRLELVFEPEDLLIAPDPSP